MQTVCCTGIQQCLQTWFCAACPLYTTAPLQLVASATLATVLTHHEDLPLSSVNVKLLTSRPNSNKWSVSISGLFTETGRNQIHFTGRCLLTLKLCFSSMRLSSLGILSLTDQGNIRKQTEALILAAHCSV